MQVIVCDLESAFKINQSTLLSNPRSRVFSQDFLIILGKLLSLNKSTVHIVLCRAIVEEYRYNIDIFNKICQLKKNICKFFALQRTSGKWGGGGFEISDIPGRGKGVFVKVRTSENF